MIPRAIFNYYPIVAGDDGFPVWVYLANDNRFKAYV